MIHPFRNNLIWLLLAILIPVLSSAQWTALDPGFNANRSVTVLDREIFVASYLTGVKVSSDQGQSWTDRNTGIPAPGGHIYIESIGSDGTWLYAGTHDGIYRSVDGGLNWTAASGVIGFGSDNYVERFFSIGNVTFAIMSKDPLTGGGIFRTDNYGSTWNIGHSGMLGCGKVTHITFHEGRLYASAQGGVFISDDLGLSWTQLPTHNYAHSYMISESNSSDHVIAGQFGISYSDDGGDTWNATGGPSNYDRCQLHYFNNSFIAIVKGNDAGVWSSTNGANWSRMTGFNIADEISLEDAYEYGCELYVGAILNIYKLTQTGVSIAPKVVLGACYNPNNGKMRDDLRDLGYIPLEEPFTYLGFAHYGNGGSEEITPQVLTANNSDAIVDWVLIELRDQNNESIILETKSALLQRDGDIVSLYGQGPLVFNVSGDAYFVAVRHRDHLGVMTLGAIDLSTFPISLDFTSAITAVYGTDACMYSNGIRQLWPGNVTNDGVLRFAGENNDRDPILEKIGSISVTPTVTGYHAEDINMDGVVSYDGPNNDRQALQYLIGAVPTRTILEQLP